MTHALYQPIELAFRGESAVPAGPVAPVTVTFRHGSGEEVSVDGFWDGGTAYRARFLPEAEGAWTWEVARSLTPLDQTSGSFDVADAEGHGPVRVVETFHFAHADGAPFRPVGATVYNWIHQDEPLVSDTVASLREAGFNKLRFMVFPQAGGSVEHAPTLMPFEKTDDRWDVTRPVPEFFQRLDGLVRDLGEAGIEADVLILNAYDRGVFGLDELTEEEDAIYVRYLVSRLAAFPHVWWSLCNEYDQLLRPEDRWDRLGEFVARIDPYDHPRSIHNWMHIFDNNRPWVTHASIQNGSVTEAPGRARTYRDAYYKPIVLDEIKYEGDAEARWGRLSAKELVDRFWITTIEGCYASHGESFVTDSGSLHIVEGGRLRGDSPARLGFLRGVLDDLVVPGLNPIDKWDDPEYGAGWAPKQYLIYLGSSAPAAWRIRIPIGYADETKPQEDDRYAVDLIDTWNMTITRAGTFALDEVHRDFAFAGSDPIAIPEGEAIAVRLTRADLA